MATNDAAVVSVITAIEAVVKDSCLQVKAPRIVKLQELGRAILQKQREADRETASQFSDFSTALCKTIREFVTAHSGKHKSLPTLRTKLWAQFHHECNTSLPTIWAKKFPSTLLAEPCSILFQQSVNEKLFEILLPKTTTNAERMASGTGEDLQTKLSPSELNVLRYACGFVPYKLLRRFEKKDHCKYAKFVECLGDMAVDGDEDGDLIAYTRKWSAIVNRGGLFPLNDSTFLFFLSVEKLVRVLLPQHILCSQSHSKESLRAIVIKRVAGNDEVQWRWALLSQCIDSEEDNTELLEEIVQLWVTVRGFAMTATWLETFKVQSNTTTAKKPSLRKGLQ